MAVDLTQMESRIKTEVVAGAFCCADMFLFDKRGGHGRARGFGTPEIAAGCVAKYFELVMLLTRKGH